jgi:aspartyl-tRNA(Asn)/glutamyl-tRNA(Gln) amidotransferase subunit B
LEESKDAEIVQETRGWDESKQKTFSQRKKEGSADYRYFPDPDLPKLKLHEAFELEKIKKELPELPEQKRVRYRKDFGIKNEDIEVYLNEPELASWFEMIIQKLDHQDMVKIASNYITSDYLGIRKNYPDIIKPMPARFAQLITMVFENQISSRVAKDILAIIVVNDESPLEIAEREGLLQSNDEGALKEIAQKIIDANPKVVADYKSGKENALMSLVGQIMKETKGSANPAVAKDVLLSLLARP